MVDVARLALRVDALEVKTANAQLNKLGRTSGKTEKQVTSFSQRSNAALVSLRNTVGGVAAAFVSISAGRSIIQANLQIERFTNALTVGTGSARAAAEEMKFLRQQSEQLGLNFAQSAEQFSKLSAAAKGTALQGQATRDIFTSIAQASTVLGLSAEQSGGALNAIQQIISKGTVSAEELRGQLGERLPGAFQIAARSIDVTTQELGKMLQRGEVLAEDLLPAFAVELEKTFGDQAIAAAQGLNAQINRMENALFDLQVAVGQAGLVDLFSDGLQVATKFVNFMINSLNPQVNSMASGFALAGDAVRSLGIIVGIVGDAIGATAARVKALLEFDFTTSRQISADFEANLRTQIESMSKLQDRVAAARVENELLTDAVGKLNPIIAENTDELEGNTEGLGGNTDAGKKARDERKKFIQALEDEREEIGKSASEIKKLEAERLGILDTAGPLIDAIERENAAFDRQQDILAEVDDITEKFLTSEQRLNRELARLEELLQSGALDWQTYQAAVASVTTDITGLPDKLDAVSSSASNIFTDINQTGIQAARNIQTAFADFLFNPFEDGLKGMFRSFADILRRMAAEIAASTILKNVFGLFQGGGLTAGAAGASFGGIPGTGGAFSNIPGLLSQGAINRGGGGLLGGLGGIGTVLGTGALSVGIGSALAGDKRLFGLNGTVTSTIGTVLGSALGPVGGIIGSLAGSIFGRGPLKQQDSLIRGSVGAGGIGEDFLTATNFKAKGGLLRGDKVDRVIINANTGELVAGAPGLPESGISSKLLPFADEAAKQALQIGQLFDTTIQDFNQSLRSSANVLGIGARALDNFNTFLQITSEKGEAITEQQVAEAIADIGNQMATALVPGIEGIARGGETALATLQRVTSEFTSLEDALIVFGISAEQANAAISALSVATRTELVDAAGGVEALNSQITFFANNFLTAQEQLDIGFSKLDREMRALGLSANITAEEFKNIIISVTRAGGASVELASSLLRLAPQFLDVKRAEEQVAAEAARASGQLSGLAGSISGVASASAASFQRIDNARAVLENAQRGLATAEAQAGLSSAQNELSLANEALSTARSNLAQAQSAEQGRISNEISGIISERNELISAYQSEAQALRGVVDRFGALSDRILDFKDSLALGNLSPFSPGEQLAIARQQFNVTRNAAANGDEAALARLPEVSRSFLEASKTFNGATGAFESDFNFVQEVLESSGVIARATRDIAAEQLSGIESTIRQLQELNEQTQKISQGIGNLNESSISVEQALADVASAESRAADAQAGVESATNAVEDALFIQNGFIDDVGQATIQVRDAVRELGAAILQGFGNAFIRDQQIRDFVLANPNQPDSFFANAAINAGLSGSQVINALAPLGVTPERVNKAFGGLSVRDNQIATVVDQKLAEGDLFGIYQAAIANGITSDRLAASSQLTKEQINQFVQANNLQPFRTGTDFVPRDGIAMLHKGEAVVPSSTTDEIKKLRQEVIELRREQNQQMSALINTNIQANKENAQAIAKSNERMAANANWQNRARPKVA